MYKYSAILLFLFSLVSYSEISQAKIAFKLPVHLFPQKKNKIVESQDIMHLMSRVDKHTLVIFDLEYTLFRSTTYLGTPEWSNYLLKKELNLTKNKENSIKKNYSIWLKAQHFNEIELMDARIPKIIKDLKHKALGYVVVTPRQGSSFEVTQWQLNKFDIDCVKSPFAAFTYNSTFNNPVVYREGILFSDSNNLAEVFSDWLKQIMPQLKKMRSIRRIVFVNHSMENVKAMEAVAEQLNLEYFGLHYNLADEFKKGFNPKLVEAETRILMGNHSDSEIRLLLESIGSFAESS